MLRPYLQGVAALAIATAIQALPLAAQVTGAVTICWAGARCLLHVRSKTGLKQRVRQDVCGITAALPKKGAQPRHSWFVMVPLTMSMPQSHGIQGA